MNKVAKALIEAARPRREYGISAEASKVMRTVRTGRVFKRNRDIEIQVQEMFARPALPQRDDDR